MIINIPKLTDFSTNYIYDVEEAVQQMLCKSYNLVPGTISTGYFSNWDFIMNDKTFELKISSKGLYNSVIELSRANGKPSGLSATTADHHIFINNNGDHGKVRLIKTTDLKKYYKKDRPGTYTTKTRGDKIGSKLAKLNFKELNDLMIGEIPYDDNLKEFDTFLRINSYAQRNIYNFINRKY